jgi:hypothetical protein
LILVRNSSTRTAIFTSSARIVANVAPRQRERFGAAHHLSSPPAMNSSG